MFEKDVLYMQGTLAQDAFVHHLYAGLNKAEACAQMNINPVAVAIARRDNKSFNAAIREAEASHIDNRVDELMDVHHNFADPLMARVWSDNTKWIASKKLREIYGEKVDHTVEHKISLTAAMDTAKTRLLKFIDGKCVELLNNQTDMISVEQDKPIIIDSQGDENDDPFA